MSIFVKATAAPKPKSEYAKQIALMYAVVLVVMAVAQLFTYDAFIELIISFNFPIPETAQYLIAPLLIVCEVFALPFLLRMRISPAFRVVSMLCSWLVPVKWFLLTLWVVNSGQPVESIGFLGSIGELTPGWWAVLISVSLGIMSAWSSWGLWPFPGTKK
jgi:hypothetical protein